MYQQYFGLTQTPFSITPDPAFLYLSQHHREALAHLQYVANNNGFVLLSGEIGSGKTTLIRQFLQQLPDNVDTAVILNPRLSATELIAEILRDLCQINPQGMTHPEVLKRLNDQLLHAHSQGRRVVLIIDEAQDLNTDLLEQLRLLTNLETAQHKLLQIILVGQPELRSSVQRPELEQLLQRITADFHLQALPDDEIGPYIDHRLSVAGAQRPLFTKKAITAVGKASRGAPRLINALCDRALLGAYVEQAGQVDHHIVKQAAHELLSLGSPAPDGWLARGIIYLSSAAALLGTLAGGWLLWQINTPPVRPALQAHSSVQSPAQAQHPKSPEQTGLIRSSAATPPPAHPAQNRNSHPQRPDLADKTNTFLAGIPPVTGDATGDVAADISKPAPATGPLNKHQSAANQIRASKASDQRPSPNTPAPPQQAVLLKSPPAEGHPEPAPSTRQAHLLAKSKHTSSPPLPTVSPPSGQVTSPEQIAIQNLFQAWELDYTKLHGWPCQRANSQGLYCIRGISGIAGLKKFNRPALLHLSINGRDATQPVVIVEYNDKQGALLLTAHGKQRLSSKQLKARWSGDFLTIWRPPKGFWRAANTQNETLPWIPVLRQQLAKLGFKPQAKAHPNVYDKALIQTVRRFQKSQGLSVDGKTGKLTLMRINTLLGHAPVLRPPSPSMHALIRQPR